MSADSVSTDEIERELDDTRFRLDATIGALQQKLAPSSMVDEAITYFMEGGGVEVTRSLARSVRDNPVPVALIGVGLGWMMFGRARRSDPDPQNWDDRRGMRDGRFGGGIDRGPYGRHSRPGGFPGNMPVHQPMPYEAAARDDLATRVQKAGAAVQRRADEAEGVFQERVEEARATVLGLTRQAGEAADSFRRRVEEALSAGAARVGSAMSDAADMAHDLADRGRATARDVYDYGAAATANARAMGSRTVDYVQDQPLLLGALGLSVGAVIGLLLPASRYERRVAGTVRERLGEAARDAVGDARDRAMRVADTVLDAAQDAARREGMEPPRGGVGPAMRENVADVAGRARRVVEETAAAGRGAVEREVAPEAGRHETPRPHVGTANAGRVGTDGDHRPVS